MSLLDRARLEIKIDDYATAPAGALADPLLLGRVQQYRRVIGGVMKPLDKNHLTELADGDWLVSRKMDGEFTALVVENDEALTVNPGGTVRVGLPFFPELKQHLAKAGVKRILLLGELYVARPDGARARVHDVSRVARRPTSSEEVQSLRFAVFDLLEIDGKDLGTAYSARWKQIASIFPETGKIHRVETVPLKTRAEITALFERWVEKEGAEGLVAKSDTTGYFKIKPRHTLDVAVIGYAEGIGDSVGLLHDLLLAVMRQDGALHVLGRVGGGFTTEQRRTILADLKDMHCASEYVEVNSDRVAYQMIRPELVAEISCLDLISQNTRGAALDSMILLWDAAAQSYIPQRPFPLANLISPIFIRFRADKKVTPQDVRIDQLTAIVEIANADRPAADLVLPPSTLLRRQVATKTMKGAQLVRKLVLWKTNKEEQSDLYPAFVLHLTDFSPNRKTPLEREIRVSNSRMQIDGLWKALEEEYFVKGWNVVASSGG